MKPHLHKHRAALALHLVASACAAAALLTALPAQAADNWTEIASTPRKKVLLQHESIKPHGDAVEAWTLYRYDELQTDVGKTPFRTSRYLYDYDCKGGREKMRRVISHNGPLEVHDIDLARRSDWKAVGGPTTVSGIVFKRVCAQAR
ncbi:MAG: hypothetical protein U1B84_29220 [Variovorax sp.]|nr:hypothetical protein [Variovorax sp.]